jgi:diguanylate cyclase (GGDEF)-like protein
VGFLVEQRAPDSPAPDLFEAVRGLLADGAQTRLDLDSTVAELVEKYELLSVLYDSAATIVSISSLEEVSQRILDEAAQTLEVEYASLMLIEESGTSLRVAAARGLRSDSGGKTSIELGEGIAGYVARQGKPLLVEDLSTHELACQATREEYRPGSLLSVPLKVKDRVLGVLNVNKTTGPPFRTGDLKLLSALADLAALSIENARTYQNAITDRLTSLYNYGYFKEQLEASLEAARKAGATLSLVMFDIDHFKNFNDKNGHELGNMVLVGVAAICLANCRQKPDRVPDLVARYGGEEFIIMLQGVSRDDAFRVAERIRRLVQDEPFEGAENQPGGRVTISLGVASFPDDALTSDALINRADEALYRAKRSGRNNVQLA